MSAGLYLRHKIFYVISRGNFDALQQSLEDLLFTIIDKRTKDKDELNKESLFLYKFT